jgi:hypothetical protein
MSILKEAISDRLKPLRKGGVTFYPAAAMAEVFGWAADSGRTIEWVEGLFYRPETDDGQLSTAYICQRKDWPSDFRQRCLKLAEQIEPDAASRGMGGYFEIGISE